MKIVATTDRLVLREFEESDALSFFELNNDPEVLKYTGDQAFQSIEEARQFVINYDHYKKYGFGRWAVILKESNEFIGWCGIKYSSENNYHDLGYRFFRKHWNKGYATEAALASLNVGFNNLQLDSIHGRAMKENLGSIKVLGKIGMHFLREVNFHEHTGVLYVINK